MTTSTDLDRLRAESERAEQRFDAARAAAEEAAAREALRKAERERRWDEAVLQRYDPEHLDSDVTAAQRALEEALDTDPAVQAAVRLRQAQGARHGAAIIANSIRQRFGADPVHVPSPCLVDLHAAVRTYVEHKGADAVAAAEDRYWAERERAADE